MVDLLAYLLGKQGVRDAMFLPETLFLDFYPSMQHFN
jgi:hypothetical protein